MSKSRIIKKSILGPDVIVLGQQQWTPHDDAEAASGTSPTLAQAHFEAQRLINTAVAESEAMKKAAYEQGYRDGLVAVRAEMGGALATLRELALGARLDSEQMLRANEEQLIDLALAVARKVVGQELGTDRSFVVNAVKEAVACVEAGNIVRIRISPNDFEILTSYWREAYGDKEGLSGTEIIADPKVQPGGCVIDTRTGVIDAQIATKFTEIADTLQAVRTEYGWQPA